MDTIQRAFAGGRRSPWQRRGFGGLVIAAAATVALAPAAFSAGTVQPGDVLSYPGETCFVGTGRDSGCTAAKAYGNDWVLAGAGQDAQIMSTGRAATNDQCPGAYYLKSTIVSTLDATTFTRTFRPAKSGVTITPSGDQVPTGLYAYDITGPYDAYSYTALLYRRQIEFGDAHAAGRVSPMYSLTLNPSPRVGPGTMPLPAQGAPHWAPPKGIGPTFKRSLVVFDTSDLATKQDVAPPDGWQDSTAGHGTFVRGIAQAAFSKSTVPLVDITASDSLVTEGTKARTIETYAFAAGAVANLSAGTYFCQVATNKGVVAISSVVLPQLVNWLDTKKVHLVAAAGNDATTREFYPAAYGVRPTPEYRAVCPATVEPVTGLCLTTRARTVTSVGSLLTSSKGFVLYTVPAAVDRSPFSNYGDWVEAWADGSEVVSDYPDVAYWYCVPTAAPGTCEASGGGTMADSTAGAAHLTTTVLWSGTSFAAPQAAVWIAAGNPAP